MTVPVSEWRWFGEHGHYILGRWCRFHLCTQIGDYLVSTVGKLVHPRQTHGSEAGDERFLEANLNGEPIGLDHFYEVTHDRHAHRLVPLAAPRRADAAQGARNRGDTMIVTATIFKAHVVPASTETRHIPGYTEPQVFEHEAQDFGPAFCRGLVREYYRDRLEGYRPPVHIGHHDAARNDEPEHVGHIIALDYDESDETVRAVLDIFDSAADRVNGLKPAVELMMRYSGPDVLKPIKSARISSLALVQGPLRATIDAAVPRLVVVP